MSIPMHNNACKGRKFLKRTWVIIIHKWIDFLYREWKNIPWYCFWTINLQGSTYRHHHWNNSKAVFSFKIKILLLKMFSLNSTHQPEHSENIFNSSILILNEKTALKVLIIDDASLGKTMMVSCLLSSVHFAWKIRKDFKWNISEMSPYKNRCPKFESVRNMNQNGT